MGAADAGALAGASSFVIIPPVPPAAVPRLALARTFAMNLHEQGLDDDRAQPGEGSGKDRRAPHAEEQGERRGSERTLCDDIKCKAADEGPDQAGIQTDATNVLTVFRLLKADLEGIEVGEFFLPGGLVIDEKLFRDLASVSDIDEVLDKLKPTPYGKPLGEAAMLYLETNSVATLERVLDIMSELEPRLRSLERQAKRANEYIRAQADLKGILREWYGYHWHRAQKELTDAREMVKVQEVRVNEMRQAHVKAQEAYNTFRERFTGLRAQLNAWHRRSAELHNQREEVSRELAVLEERRRSLLSAQSSVLADTDRASDEERIAHERFAEIEQEVQRLQAEFEEAQKQYTEAQQALQKKQTERAEVEANLKAARAEIDKWSAQRAEAQAAHHRGLRQVAVGGAPVDRRRAEDRVAARVAGLGQERHRVAEPGRLRVARDLQPELVFADRERVAAAQRVVVIDEIRRRQREDQGVETAIFEFHQIKRLLANLKDQFRIQRRERATAAHFHFDAWLAVQRPG